MTAPSTGGGIDTHGMIVDFGKHRGERWTRMPVSYLRWIVNVPGGHSRAEIAQAELDRRGISAIDQPVEITGHAIDSASLRVRKLWHEDRGQDEGLHAWLLRICQEALSEHEIDDQGRIHFKGMRLVFDRGELLPILKTVMRQKRRKPAAEATDDPPWDVNSCESCNDPAVRDGLCEFHYEVRHR